MVRNGKRRSPIKTVPRGSVAVNKLVSRAIGAVLSKARQRDNMKKKRAANPEKYKEINLHATRKFYKDHPEKVRKWNKQYAKDNHAKMRENDREYRKERRVNDTHYTIKARLRSRIQSALKRKRVKKSEHTHALLGMALDEFKTIHVVPGEHLDHIFPFEHYKLEDVEQQKKVCNYKNLQSLTEAENRNKGSRLPTKAMAVKVPRELWPDGVTEDMLPDIYDGWATPLRMEAPSSSDS